MAILNSLAYIILAPFIGGLLSGIDRKITARMQSRCGPSIFQGFYDVAKLFEKENIVVRKSQNFYIIFFLVFVIFTGALFFSGSDLLLVIFSLTLASIFFVLGGYKTSSPYAIVGAERELIQIVSYEPMVLIAAIGMYMVTKSFQVDKIASSPKLLVLYLPAIFAGFVFILATKFRKSPFDLSTSHHAHQEVVKGITTEFSGPILGLIEIAHWYENILILGFIYLFFASSIQLAIICTALTYLFEIFIDNCFSRVKWQMVLFSSWVIALTLGLGNILVLSIFFKNM